MVGKRCDEFTVETGTTIIRMNGWLFLVMTGLSEATLLPNVLVPLCGSGVKRDDGYFQNLRHNSVVTAMLG